MAPLVAATRARLASIAVLVGAAVLFAWLVEETVERRRFAWDGELLRSLTAVEAGAFEAAMVPFAFLGAGLGLLLVLSAVLAFLLRRGRAYEALFVAVSLAVAQILERIVKEGVDRPRPPFPDREMLHAVADLRRAVIIVVLVALAFAMATRRRWIAIVFAAVFAGAVVVYEVITPAIVGSDRRSFPSGHATGSMAVAAAVAIVAWPFPRRWTVLGLCAVFVVGVGVSRLSFGVHYPSDVLGGWLVAAVAVAATSLVVPAVVGCLRTR